MPVDTSRRELALVLAGLRKLQRLGPQEEAVILHDAEFTDNELGRLALGEEIEALISEINCTARPRARSVRFVLCWEGGKWEEMVFEVPREVDEGDEHEWWTSGPGGTSQYRDVEMVFAVEEVDVEGEA